MIYKYWVHDHESYYSQDYSLRKMTPVEYILDPRFEHIGCAVAHNDADPAVWLDPFDYRSHLLELRDRQRRGEKIVLVSHNALFDMCLMAWRYGFVADLHVDTMSMARALTYHETGSVSLASVANHLGIGAKTDTILKAIGMGRAALMADPGLWAAYRRYAINDADLCRQIFIRLRDRFPPAEFLVNDLVVRMAMVPRFKLDATVLAEHLHVTRASKDALLARCGLDTRETLMSNDKFADALRQRGVEPPTKISATTGRETYAFAKTDPGMVALQEHEDEEVQALAAARLGHKSTQEETRTERFLSIANLQWPGKAGSGWMPVPIRYSGAATHRFSGDWQLNLQNLPRKSPLRRALVAPPGYVVVAADLSQIEARLVAYVAGQDDLVEAFRAKRDVYSEFAGEEVFHRVVTKADVPERFVGKTSILQLGFGAGGPKFATTVRTLSRLQIGQLIDMQEDEGRRIVDAYRRRYADIARAWRVCSDLIPVLLSGSKASFDPCTVEDGAIVLPSGLRLHYTDLQQQIHDGKVEWRYRYGKKWERLYGAKTFQNMIQSLARIVITNAALTMKRHFPKHPVALQVHDELVYVVPQTIVPEFKAALEEAMVQRVPWAPGIPLACECGVGPNYGEAK